jgi:hypothetical protein
VAALGAGAREREGCLYQIWAFGFISFLQPNALLFVNLLENKITACGGENSRRMHHV